MLSPSALRRDLQRRLALGRRQLREVLGRQHPQVEAGAAAADLDVVLGLARLDLDRLRRRASGRPRPAAGRAAGPSPRLSTSASSVVSQPQLEVGGRQRHAGPRSAVRRIPERAWVAARVETALETIESLETSSSRLVVSFKCLDAFLSWIRACGKSWSSGGIRRARRGLRPVDAAVGKALILAVPSAVSRLPAAGLWIAPRNSWTRCGELGVLGRGRLRPGAAS